MAGITWKDLVYSNPYTFRNSNLKMPTAREILERFYNAERAYMASPPDQADFSDMQATLSPDVKLYQSPDLIYGGVYEGYSGFLEWSKKMSSYWDKVDPTVSNILENGD